MDDEEKLRIRIIIENIQKKSKVKSAILEQIKQDLEKGVHITEEEKNYVLELWKKYKNKSSVKKPKLIYKNPMFLVLTIILVISFVAVISLTMIDSRSEPVIIEREDSSPEPVIIEREDSRKRISDTKNSFLEKFGKLENNREEVVLEFNSEETIDNKLWQVYDVIRIEADASRSNVGFLMFSTPNGYVETIIFKITHNFDIDVMGIPILLFESIGKEYIYLWSDEACFDEKYDDKCFDNGYNNKHMHFLNGGADGLTWKERADIISGVSVGVEREFKEYFTANFHLI